MELANTALPLLSNAETVVQKQLDAYNAHEIARAKRRRFGRSLVFKRWARLRGFNVEVLSDATGAIDLANEAGRASARQVHETLMVLLNSNWAAVASTSAWIAALQAGEPLEKSNLVTSAAQGRNVP